MSDIVERLTKGACSQGCGTMTECICVTAEEAADTITRLQAEVERLRAALEEIASQKKTDELVTACDVEYADFEDGYDTCISRARAALQPPAREDSV